MINLVERRLVTIKPQEAAQMIKDHNEYRGQRPLRQTHVDFLAGKMENNRFQEAQIAFARLPDGTSTCLNGQHSLRGCVKSNVPIDASIRVYECRDELDLFILYSEMDQGLRRNQNDVTRAGRNIMPASLHEVGSGVLAQYGAAILMAPLDGRPALFQSRAISPQKRVSAVCAHPEEALFLDRYHGHLLFNRIAVRMAMVATFRADAGRALGFWDAVIDTDHLPAADPRHRLARLLLDKQHRSRTAVAVRELYIRCLDHWNALAMGGEVPEYDGNRTVTALKPTAPLPTLATVRIASRSSAPQSFPAVNPAVVPMRNQAAPTKMSGSTATA